MIELDPMSDKVRNLILFLIIGALGGIYTFKLAQEGKIPLKTSSPPQLSTNNQTRTVVQEESAVISVVEKTSPSVIQLE